jgi:endonuclease/exonuclease/phosphatase family metal-dependent hydrolase
MADAIRKCDADIVGLNEMRGDGLHPEYTAQTEKLSELTGMENYFFAKALDLPQGMYGNAFLSKIPIIRVENIPIPDPNPKKYSGYYETRCLLKAVLENGVTVLVSHFGLNRDEQENAVKTVLENLEEKKCVLMGDFNMCPSNFLLDMIRARLNEITPDGEGYIHSFPSKISTILFPVLRFEQNSNRTP